MENEQKFYITLLEIPGGWMAILVLTESGA